MKALVAYSTKTGNTKKVAESIANSINDAGKTAELLDIDEVKNQDYDLTIVGTWIDRGTADAKAVRFIQSLANKNTAFFFTLGAYPDSKHAQDCVDAITNLFAENSNKVLGHFHCQGAVDPQLIEMMKSMFGPDHPHGPNPERVKRWADASTHPDKTDLDNAYSYFKELVSKL